MCIETVILCPVSKRCLKPIQCVLVLCEKQRFREHLIRIGKTPAYPGCLAEKGDIGLRVELEKGERVCLDCEKRIKELGGSMTLRKKELEETSGNGLSCFQQIQVSEEEVGCEPPITGLESTTAADTTKGKSKMKLAEPSKQCGGIPTASIGGNSSTQQRAQLKEIANQPHNASNTNPTKVPSTDNNPEKLKTPAIRGPSSALLSALLVKADRTLQKNVEPSMKQSIPVTGNEQFPCSMNEIDDITFKDWTPFRLLNEDQMTPNIANTLEASETILKTQVGNRIGSTGSIVDAASFPGNHTFGIQLPFQFTNDTGFPDLSFQGGLSYSTSSSFKFNDDSFSGTVPPKINDDSELNFTSMLGNEFSENSFHNSVTSTSSFGCQVSNVRSTTARPNFKIQLPPPVLNPLTPISKLKPYTGPFITDTLTKVNNTSIYTNTNDPSAFPPNPSSCTSSSSPSSNTKNNNNINDNNDNNDNNNNNSPPNTNGKKKKYSEWWQETNKQDDELMSDLTHARSLKENSKEPVWKKMKADPVRDMGYVVVEGKRIDEKK